jgi:prophage regulatory protein
MIAQFRLTGAVGTANIGVIPDWDENPYQKGARAMDSEYLDSLDLEELTGTKASTWRYWASIGQGPASFKLGRRRVWRKSDVLAWIAEQETASA